MSSAFDEKPLARPEAVAQSTHLQPQSPQDSSFDLEKGKRDTKDFNPCSNAKFCSPFYDHDSPRVSSDYYNKSKAATTVQVYALSTQTSNQSFAKKKQCLTKPAPGRFQWWKNLPKKQKLALEVLFAFVIVGAIVGLAVGLTKKVGGGVVKNQNEQGNVV